LIIERQTVLFSSKPDPVNVFTDIFLGGYIEIGYTFGRSGRAKFLMGHSTVRTNMLPKMLELMTDDTQSLTIKIRPRLAYGQPFTTGNAELDKVAGDAIVDMTVACKTPAARIRVEVKKRQHTLVLSTATAHVSITRNHVLQAEFLRLENFSVSTKGTAAFDRLNFM
jgi:hypothetical protein